ncbi:hypothetical protein [Rhodococcus sp. M8-35]|uniref:hypothetical protein n=1 Tax=Rhodococcus sp. M8-35 TaxID=3058401 RepID=UPI002ED6B156
MNLIHKAAITLALVSSAVLGGAAPASASPAFDLLSSIAGLVDTGSSNGSGGSNDGGSDCSPFCG